MGRPEPGSGTGAPALVIAEDFTQVVAHVLAHVPVSGPGSLYDPRYLAWVRARAGADELALLTADAELLARVWAADDRHDHLHGLVDLHWDWAGFRACADRALAELGDDEVAAPGLLAALRGLPGAELVHACCALVGPSVRARLAADHEALAAALARTQPWLAQLAAVVPGFVAARVELVWALGVHGRALPGRILVGAPVAWSGCSPARQAILAAHEHCVVEAARAAEVDDYASEEWAALRALASRLDERGGAAEPLRAAHRAWLASVDLGPLVAELRRRGRIDAGAAAALLAEPERRAALLSAGP